MRSITAQGNIEHQPAARAGALIVFAKSPPGLAGLDPHQRILGRIERLTLAESLGRDEILGNLAGSALEMIVTDQLQEALQLR
jgi:hypothetical protein